MNEFLLLKFLHVIGLAYWLGGDLGVFYSSFVVSNESASPQIRTAAAKMLFALDQAPRICMTMMLPLGLHLTWSLGLFGFSGTVMATIWLVAILWLLSVVFLHFGSSQPAKALLTKVDYWFRVAVSLALIVSGVAALMSDKLTLPYWVAVKLIIFGALIALGLLVRIVLREFGPAFGNLAAGNPGEADNAAIRRSLGRTRPFVICIWIGLLLSAALGLHLI